MKKNNQMEHVIECWCIKEDVADSYAGANVLPCSCSRY